MELTLAIGIATGCVYALVAIGYSLIYRTTAVVNFTQGSYVMIGGLGTSWFSVHAGWPYPLAIAGGVLAATLAGLGLWLGVVLLQTIIFGAILSNGALLVVGPLPQTLPPWIPGFGWEFAGNRIDGQYILVVAATVLLIGGFVAFLRLSFLGRAMRACAASRQTAELLGISPERVGAIAFAATAALGGFAGAMITPAQYTSADAGLAYGVYGFVAAVLGGFGSLPGAIFGGLLLGIVNALVGRYISSSYQTVIAFGLLLSLLAVRPQGIFGAGWENS